MHGGRTESRGIKSGFLQAVYIELAVGFLLPKCAHGSHGDSVLQDEKSDWGTYPTGIRFNVLPACGMTGCAADSAIPTPI